MTNEELSKLRGLVEAGHCLTPAQGMALVAEVSALREGWAASSSLATSTAISEAAWKARAHVAEVRVNAAFLRGVEAMREAAVVAVDCPAPECACEGHPHALAIRALTIPEEN